MSKYQQEEVSRRGFLKAAVVTAAAATVTGAGTAALKQGSRAAPTVITTSPAASPTLTVPQLGSSQGATEAFAQLTSIQAENMRLQAALDAANRQLASLQQHESNATNANQTIQTELASANERLSVMAGLFALYEQLEEIDLDTVLDNGLETLSDAFNNLIEDVPDLEESLENGKLALAEVENHLPLLENGRAWLDGQAGKLDTYFQQVETLLREAVEVAGPLLEMINEWFAGIKKWLPFGIGEKAATIMHSVTTLIAETPGTVSGLQTNIAQPLDIWLARDDQNEVKLKSKLINPLRNEVMAKTSDTLLKAKAVETTYTTEFKEPLTTAVSQKETIRTLISEYRQQHQI